MVNRSYQKLIDFIFLFSLIGGFGIRLYHIILQPFWFDEAFTYFLAVHPVRQLLDAVLSDNNPPLYYFIIHLVTVLTHSVFWLRFPSLIFNYLTLLVLFKLSKELLNKNAAYLTAVLFQLSPLSIYMATTARLHSLGLFFVTIIIYRFYWWMKNPGKFPLSLLLSLLLGLYTQYYVGLIILPITFWVYFRNRFLLRNWFKILLFVILGFFPWIILALKTSHAGCACPPTFQSLPAILAGPSLGGMGEVTLRFFLQLPAVYYLLFGSTVSVSLFLLIHGFRKLPFISWLFVIPVLLISIINFFVPFFSPKGWSIFLPVFLIAVTAANKYYQIRKYLVLYIILLITVNITQTVNPFFSGTPFPAIAKEISTKKQIPVIHTSTHTYYSVSFYERDMQNYLITPNPLPENSVKYIGGETKIIPSADLLWLVDSSWWIEPELRQNILKQINRNYSVLSQTNYGVVQVYLLRKNTR